MEPLPLSQVSLECVQESSGTTWSGCACLLERKSRAAVASARAWVPYLPISWVSFCCEVVLIANSGCLPRTNTQLQVPPRRSTNPAERVAWRMMRDCPAVAQQPWWTSRRYKYGQRYSAWGTEITVTVIRYHWTDQWLFAMGRWHGSLLGGWALFW